jgi:hypothetical protein
VHLIALFQQRDAMAQKHAQLADFRRRHETAIKAPVLQILGDALSVAAVALAPRQRFD